MSRLIEPNVGIALRSFVKAGRDILRQLERAISAQLEKDIFQAFSSSFIGQLIVFGYAWAVLHHLLSSIRLFASDLGCGFRANEREVVTRVAAIFPSISKGV